MQSMLVSKKLIARARDLRQRQSRAERIVWSLVRGRRLGGAKFRRQFPISRYIADFVCAEARLIVEVDGRSHDLPEQEEYDFARTRVLERLGWRVLRIRDDEIVSNPGAAARTIAAWLEAASPLTLLPQGEGEVNKP